MRLFALKEIAEILGVSTRSIHRYIRQGKLNAKKPAGRWRISQEDLDKFLEAGRPHFQEDAKVGRGVGSAKK